MSSKGINIKVSRVKIIELLKQRLDEMQKINADQKKLDDKFDKELREFNELVVKTALPYIHQANRVSIYNRSDAINLDIYLPANLFTLPEAPEKEYVESSYTYYGKQTLDEVKQAIRLLELSDEEVVNTSTYKSIMQYL